MADTRPAVDTVARALLLLHVPPDIASVKSELAPVHMDEGADMLPADGNAVTVTGKMATAAPQLPDTVYRILSVPAARPVTRPVPLTAAFVLVADQLPPGVASVNSIEDPAQILPTPRIVPAERNAPIVTTFVATATPHTVETVYDIVSVPALTGVNKPVPEIVACALLTDHTPPVAMSV